MWHIKVPASSANLGSGLDTLGMAVSLWLDCWFTPGRTLSIDLLGEGQDMLPADERNLVWESAEIVHRALTNKPMPRGHLVISSQIPLGRGLGSSAAAVVAGITLANIHLKAPLSPNDLFQWAVKIEGHPDNVGAALFGGMILAWTGPDMVSVEYYTPPDLGAVVVIPNYLVPTVKARTLLPTMVPRQDAVFNAQRVALWVHALNRRDWSLLRYAGEDRLHQPYRQPLIPGMPDIIDAALAAGAHFAALSGSGPTILALAAPAVQDAVVAAVREVLATLPHIDATIQTVSPSPDGVQAVPCDSMVATREA